MDENKKTKRRKKKKNTIIKEVKKAAIGGALGLAGRAALSVAGSLLFDHTTGEEFLELKTEGGNIIHVWSGNVNINELLDTEISSVAPLPENENIIYEEIVQADPVPLNENGLSFSEAFANAREELGPGGIFEWNGNTYNTFYAEELKNITSEQLSAWYAAPDDEKISFYHNIIDDLENHQLENDIAEGIVDENHNLNDEHNENHEDIDTHVDNDDDFDDEHDNISENTNHEIDFEDDFDDILEDDEFDNDFEDDDFDDFDN